MTQPVFEKLIAEVKAIATRFREPQQSEVTRLVGDILVTSLVALECRTVDRLLELTKRVPIKKPLRHRSRDTERVIHVLQGVEIESLQLSDAKHPEAEKFADFIEWLEKLLKANQVKTLRVFRESVLAWTRC